MARWLLPGRMALLAVAAAGVAVLAVTLCSTQSGESGESGLPIAETLDDAVEAVGLGRLDLATNAPAPTSPEQVIHAWHERVVTFDFRAIADDPAQLAEARLAAFAVIQDLSDPSVAADIAGAQPAPAVTPAAAEETWFAPPAATPPVGGFWVVAQSEDVTRIEEIGAAAGLRTFRVTTVMTHFIRGPGGEETSLDTISASEFVTVRGEDGRWRVGRITVLARR